MSNRARLYLSTRLCIFSLGILLYIVIKTNTWQFYEDMYDLIMIRGPDL